jgi:hypothetical protein
MRFVPIKNTEQQALLGLHRARQGFVSERTAQANQIRGLLSEFGLVMPVGIRSIRGKVPGILEDAENGLSDVSRALIARLFEHLCVLDRQVRELEREINAWHCEDTASQRLQAIPGIGPLTASALVASVGDAKVFHKVANLLRGLDSCHARAPPAVRRTCSASANAETRASGSTAQSEYRSRRPGEQERTYRLGAASAWPRVPRWLPLSYYHGSIATKVRIRISTEGFRQHSPTIDCAGAFQSDGITGKTGVDSICTLPGTSRVRQSDKTSTSIFHQGPRHRVALTGRMYGCNLFL